MSCDRETLRGTIPLNAVHVSRPLIRLAESERRLPSIFDILNQGIPHLQPWETGEIPIGRQQRVHAVRLADRRDPRVMYQRSGDASSLHRRLQPRPIACPLADQAQARRFKPNLQIGHCPIERRRRSEHPGMRDNRQELVNARPGNRPRRGVLRKHDQTCRRSRMPRRIRPMGIHEDVRVDRGHFDSSPFAPDPPLPE